MFPMSSRITQATFHGVRQFAQEPIRADMLGYVARREPGAPVECRDACEMSHLLAVIDTPTAALTLNALLDTGMLAEGAADLHTRLSTCRDGEILRRIMATPTLRDWASDATWQLPSESHNRSLMLSLRVLQLFGHTTSVPVVFDPENRRVAFHYVACDAPVGTTAAGAPDRDGLRDDRLRMLLHDAADGRNPSDPFHRASRNALMLLVSANDIDGRRQRAPHWQRQWDHWRHGNDHVRTLSTRLTPEFETWLAARRETAVSYSQDYVFRKALTPQDRHPEGAPIGWQRR
ncbi:hypothetical protein PIN31009_00652 [Pandoraea iniqua]|nr:hypothetical protein PIN31009_00652 [Pandoraea iniqua]